MIHTVDLKPDQLKTVHTEARARDDSYDDSPVKTTKALNMDKGETHVRGLKGEIAFAEFYGLQPDLQIRPEGDGGVDFEVEWLGSDVTVDVKTTTYQENPGLLVRENAANRADRYVLAIVDGTEVRLVGFASCDTILDAPVTEHTGHMRNHMIRADDLRALPDAPLISPQSPDQSDSAAQKIPRSPPSTFALSTRDTSDEYAKARIENTTDPAYLKAIQEKEVARDDPRQKRIAWINQQRKKIDDL
jgi:hypothetical protein